MAEQIPKALYDRKAEAKAAKVGAVLNLVILVEDAWQMLLGNPHAAVPDLDAHLVARALAAEQDLAAFGVAKRVGQEIAQHQLEHAPVAVHGELRAHQMPFQTLLLHRLEKLGIERIEQVEDGETGLRRRQDAGLESVDVEQAIEDILHQVE